MIELRKGETAREQISLGRLTPRQVAGKLPLEGGRSPDFMTSLIVEVSVTHHVGAACAASAEEPVKPAR